MMSHYQNAASTEVDQASNVNKSTFGGAGPSGLSVFDPSVYGDTIPEENLENLGQA